MTAPDNTRSPAPRAVSVIAPARLHLGFLDLHGGLGRRFGSLGMALEWPYTQLLVRRTAKLAASGPDAERALQYARILLKELRLPAVEITIEQAIPTHAGLGSGTQLALAVGTALAHLFELPLEAATLAKLLQRGARSGIGIGAFTQGGFLVDGGLGPDSELPPLLARLALPEHWRVLLIFDDHCQGVHGAGERAAFARLPEFPAASAGELCRLLLLQALPALAEDDIRTFGAAISAIQRTVGNYFAPLQGGRFTSPAVAAALDRLAREGAAGIGQSSWGPTGFALCASEADGERLLKALQQREPARAPLRLALVKPRNRPGAVEHYPSVASARIESHG
jgi:beta-RFAP synthase